MKFRRFDKEWSEIWLYQIFVGELVDNIRIMKPITNPTFEDLEEAKEYAEHIFESSEVDWRPSETIPEDYNAI